MKDSDAVVKSRDGLWGNSDPEPDVDMPRYEEAPKYVPGSFRVLWVDDAGREFTAGWPDGVEWCASAGEWLTWPEWQAFVRERTVG